MLKLLVLISLLGLALGLPANLPDDYVISRYYHETIGIPAAKRIKAAEEATNFDGSRIVGGSSAALGQYPHLGGIVITLEYDDWDELSVCGSSLLTNTKLVTAAHCWWDGRNQAMMFTVVLGSTTIFSGGTRFDTTDIQVHGFYNPDSLENDVAIVTIPWVNYNANIRNIPLASGSDLYVGQSAWAAGFGAQEDGKGGWITQSQTLHHVQIQVISNAECAEYFTDSVKPSTLCIDGSDRRSTCGGDSGGPLQIPGPVLIGITSFGYRFGCQQGWPAGFARVTSFESWIRARL
ncbi:trypsin domain-containing protein [Phthorimaea operculella]|nr:trypsin domain-containing protein [Phthorimaea operculella]